MDRETISVQSFIANLERQFDHNLCRPFTPDTLFRELPGWTSLQSLIVIISFDEHYGVAISAEELQRARTVRDLYELVTSKKAL